MTNQKNYDVIVIGGSYAGLSASMALGRASRQVLVIDSGEPCNAQTPYSHNFLTQDGKTPQEIAGLAKAQVALYPTIEFYKGLAIRGIQTGVGFEIITQAGDTFVAKKLVFATGIRDLMPEIQGFSECWGISVIHCPYCHGYEVKNEKTGLLGNGDSAFDFARMIAHWTKDLTIFTNGKSAFTSEQAEKLAAHDIQIVENKITSLEHTHGKVQQLVFENGSKQALTALYARVSFEQHCDIAQQLGCELTEMGYIKTDNVQKTTVKGIFACGDNASPMRWLSNAVATGGLAGAMVNREMIEEDF